MELRTGIIMKYRALMETIEDLLTILDSPISLVPVRNVVTITDLATSIWAIWSSNTKESIDMLTFSAAFENADQAQIHRVFFSIAPYKKKKLKLSDVKHYLCLLSEIDIQRLIALNLPVVVTQTAKMEAIQYASSTGFCLLG